MTPEHVDILSLGARVVGREDAKSELAALIEANPRLEGAKTALASKVVLIEIQADHYQAVDIRYQANGGDR